MKIISGLTEHSRTRCGKLFPALLSTEGSHQDQRTAVMNLQTGRND